MSANLKKPQETIYAIDFHALEVGETVAYNFEVDDRFFEHWPESEVQHGTGKVHAEATKHTALLNLAVTIEAQVELTCDRCLDPFRMPVHFEGEPVVKISPDIPEGESYDDNQSDGDVLWISPADDVLDLGQYVYESIILSLPFQRVHPDLEDCNPDMLERFSIVTEEEFEDLVGETDQAFDGEEMQRPFEGLKEELEEAEQHKNEK